MHELPEVYYGYYLTPEIKVNAFRERVAERIQRGKPLDIQYLSTAHGDNLIQWNAAVRALEKFSCQRGLDASGIRLRSTATFLRPFDTCPILPVAPSLAFEPDDKPSRHVYESTANNVAKSLGVSLSPEDFRYIPQPIPMDRGPLRNFNRLEAIARGKKLQDDILQHYEGNVTIVQSGSNNLKRLSDNNVRYLVHVARDVYPDHCITILSDKLFLRNTNMYYDQHFPFTPPFLDELDADFSKDDADRIVLTRNINDIVANGFASNVLITTDSYWGWLGTGSQVMREECAGKLPERSAFVLHTVATPIVWGIPGAEIVAAPILWEESEFEKGSFITPAYYQEYHRGILFGEVMRQEALALGIHPSDILSLENRIRGARTQKAA